MICKPYRGKAPMLDPYAHVAENATLIGDVTLAAGASVWYGAVLRADAAPICIGANSNIQDNCVLHCDPDCGITVGENVVVGHGAILHGCEVGDGCLIGMGAILLNGCKIGAGSVIGAGALVAEGVEVPPGSLMVGIPARRLRQIEAADRTHVLQAAASYAAEAAEQF